ncbi:cardiolipin synthetase [Mycoplasmopsis pullorum]|uniref:phospholipase D-like domain-containing protein n=1 Tax=Mycoplasmopsis pullorum TaxID=48003 RepID=UPI001118C80A|nr:phospholipase D-like domain-containing protein [Mycoplasmopsis pullorum]TNK81804.1 cardiolipin synthetase [Mycoplasmopsis pullorum]TNK86565.1 cardiolipin synthetase [Mycoplasmopsis pullorum]TNK88300.1 cardiolipin synthetase [Mycoplasmopsis pullorum]TNK88529.1 cardiolipin synthetase [Mycoplasmopsis pullorum]TNK99280.1 cardiolipin synthetase [Mycoplasmopsis pullorum]
MKKSKFSDILLWIIQIIIILAYFCGVLLLTYLVNGQFLYLLFLGIYLLNLITTFLIWKQRRQSATKLSWILVTIIFPILGHVLYYIYGLSYWNKYEFKLRTNPKFNYNLYNNNHQYSNEVDRFNSKLKKYHNMNKNGIVNSQTQIVKEGFDFYEELFNGLNEAKESIEIVSYIIKKGEIFDQLVHILEKKASEGVRIKWLIDYFGSGSIGINPFEILKNFDNVEIKYIGKIYYPFIVSHSFYRNHQKFFIIDNKKVYTGGNNISDEYASFSKRFGHFIDLNYILSGPIVNLYIIHFAYFWEVITKKEIDIIPKLQNYTHEVQNYNSDIILIDDSPNLTYSESEMYWLKLFANAQKSIKIVTPYFSITDALWKQLIIGAKSMLDIEIYIPGLPDKKFIYNITLNQLKSLSKYGVKVYIMENHFLHTKLGIVDDEIAWFGTNNFDSRSMFAQYEIMNLVSGEIVSELIEIVNDYKSKSIPLEQHKFYDKKTTSLVKVIYNLAKPLV